MSDKRKLSTILGVCGATILAAGGSIFLTDTGLSLLEKGQQTVKDAETGLSEKETEQPISVEQFTKTEDSFMVSSKSRSEEKKGEKDQRTSEKTEETDAPEASDKKDKQTETAEETEPTKQTEATEPTKQTETEEDNKSETAETEKQDSSETEDASKLYATNGVRVRSIAGVDGEILGTLQAGEGVTPTGYQEGEWVEVTYNGQIGYVSQNYLRKPGTGSNSGSSTNDGGSNNGNNGGTNQNTGNGGSNGNGSSAPAVVTWNVTPMSGTMYATYGVNIREGATTSSNRLDGLSAGQSIEVTGSTDNGWIEVNYYGQKGYVSANYLTWDKPSGGGSGGSSSGAWDDSYLYEVSSYYISESELDGWSASNLAYLRNEIFARHGRIFTSQKYIDYFSQKTWYQPTYDPSYFDANMDSFLNDYEWANLALIQKLEDARS